MHHVDFDKSDFLFQNRPHSASNFAEFCLKDTSDLILNFSSDKLLDL